MIYSILTNPTYINIMVLLLLVFLVLFLWRKIMILEGNFFILEKRVNLMKKDVREVYMANKSFDEANAVMNEVFKDSVKKEQVCNVDKLNSPKFGGCSIQPETRQNTQLAPSQPSQPLHEEITIINNMDTEIAIIHEVVDNVIHDAINKKTILDDDVQISFSDDKIISEPDAIVKSLVDNKNMDDIETQSTTSEIVFNSEGKYNQKKLSKLNLEKLKEICGSHNLSQEGTKTQLISRILENK